MTFRLADEISRLSPSLATSYTNITKGINRASGFSLTLLLFISAESPDKWFRGFHGTILNLRLIDRRRQRYSLGSPFATLPRHSGFPPGTAHPDTELSIGVFTAFFVLLMALNSLVFSGVGIIKCLYLHCFCLIGLFGSKTEICRSILWKRRLQIYLRTV